MKRFTTSLALVPMRREPSEKSEMVSQVLFGEVFDVLDENPKWAMIRMAHDDYEGWVDRKMIAPCVYDASVGPKIVTAPYMAVMDTNGVMRTIPSGSMLWQLNEGKFSAGDARFSTVSSDQVQTSLHEVHIAAMMFMGVPYLWGGRTIFGMDCSGFTQLVARLTGKSLRRDAWQQAEGGELISFLDQAITGDLAFFDNEEGRITHVGLVMKSPDNPGLSTIIHCSGQVRLDILDHEGIFNLETRTYTHKLRIIRRY